MEIRDGFRRIRRSRALGAAVALTCTLGALVSPAMTGHAAADTVTADTSVDNFCTLGEIPPLSTQPANIAFDFSMDASPQPHDGARITLSQTTLQVTLPAEEIQGGVDTGLIADGLDVPTSVDVTLSGANTIEGTQSFSLSADAIVHVVAGVAQPLVATMSVPTTTWLPSDPESPVVFVEHDADLRYDLRLPGLSLIALYQCTPSTSGTILSVATDAFVPPATFSGTLLDGGGRPDADAEVSLVARDDVTVVASTVTAADGSFAIDAPRSQYGLHIVETGDAPTLYDFAATAPYVDLTNGSRSTVISMPTWSTLNVTVTSVNGPVAGATLTEPDGTPVGLEPLLEFSVHRIGGTSPTSCTTDDSGTCALPVFLGADAQFTVSVGGDVVVPNGIVLAVTDPAATTVQVPSVPAAPSITGATVVDRSVTVSFQPPGYSGQSPISDYIAICSSSPPIADSEFAEGASSPITVTGLLYGIAYQCVVVANNSFGSGTPSDAVSPVVALSTPGAPSAVQAVAGHASASVSYVLGNNGGESIIDTTATCVSSDGGVSRSATTAASGPVLVQGLSSGYAYTCTVTARNSIDSSAPSAPSNVIVPLAPLPLPMITALSKSSGAGAGGMKIAIRGKNFGGITDLRFGDVSVGSFTVNALGTRIVAVVPPHVAGTVDVTVLTGAGTNVISPADEFTYLAPSVTRLSRTAGSHLGNTSVTIRGRNLNGAMTVLFGSVSASFQVNAAGTKIIAIAPAESAGKVDVIVTTPGGSSPAVAADQFTFV